MYQISNEYRAKMLDQVQTHRLTGTIDGISFTGDDVIGVSYRNQCADKKVNVGAVYVGVLKLTFLKDFLNRGSYDKKVITISDGLYLGLDENEDPVWEDIPVGEFYIADAVWTSEDMIDVTAYDCLSLMDKTLEIDTSSGTIYDFCKYIETKTGTVFGMTSEECAALPNGTEYLSPFEDNNMETYRDLLSALAQIIGGFGYSGKDGLWRLKSFGGSSVVAIPKNRRMSGAKYSDYTTLYDTISYVEQSTGMVRYVGDANGMTMNLGSNPFLQYGSPDAIERRCWAIVHAIENMTYTPFDAGLLPAFVALDLSDVITFASDYAGEDTTGAVMTLSWTYNRTVKVQCFGDNPALQAAQSKTDKNISGLIRETTNNEVTYYTFSNVEAITIEPEVETSIAHLAFTSAQTTTVKINHEFIMDMLSDLALDGSYEIRYYLDEQLISYKPYERVGAISQLTSGDLTDVSICRDFFYILKNVEPNNRHTWEVKVIAHGIDSVTIDANHAHVTIEGQRLYGEEYWGGYVEAKDYLTIIPFGYLSLVSMTDSVITDFYTHIDESVTETMPLLDLKSFTMKSMTDSVTVLKQGGFYFATEDGKYITCENTDNAIITE
jgi:hypothetical protein